MRYQTTIAISKFGSLISKSPVYAPPTRFEPMLFQTSCFQVARSKYTALYPRHIQYTWVWNAYYALAISRYIGLRRQYINWNIKISIDSQQWQVKIHSTQYHRNVQRSYFSLLSYLSELIQLYPCNAFLKNKKCCQNFLLSMYSRLSIIRLPIIRISP